MRPKAVLLKFGSGAVLAVTLLGRQDILLGGPAYGANGITVRCSVPVPP